MTTTTAPRAFSSKRVESAARLEMAKAARVTSPVVAAIETAWAAIRWVHPELPPVAVTISASSLMKGSESWGHFASGRWATAAGVEVHELNVAAEGLQRPVAEVFATVLHEAVHALAHTTGVVDTSRGGRYHNRKFAELAATMGLAITQVPRIGWSGTKLAEGTEVVYAAAMAKLAEALTVWRSAEVGTEGKGRKSSNNGVALVCPTCGRKVRASKAAAEAGPLWCGACLDQDALAELIGAGGMAEEVLELLGMVTMVAEEAEEAEAGE